MVSPLSVAFAPPPSNYFPRILIVSKSMYSFGYVVEGADFLSDTKEGDVIVSAKVTEGLEWLKQPK